MNPRYLTWLALLLVLVAPAHADQFRPAYLLVHQTGPETYDVLWKIPALDETTVLKVKARFPAGTEELTPHRSTYAAGASVQRWKIQVPGGLEGKEIRFDELSRTGLDLLARYERSDGTEQVARVLPVDPAFRVEASPGPFEVVLTYTKIGIEHILTGVDHLLFVLALVLIVNGWRRLVTTVTAFTIAHSITLAAATLGFVHVPSPPVEASIALSIVFVAAEIVRGRQGRAGLTGRAPWVVAFTFGLLHGLGFAGALSEVGLPQNAIPLALLFFNVGVEIGQLMFISAILAVSFAVSRVPFRNPVWGWRVLPYAIGSVAMFWVIQRTGLFLA